MYVYNREPDYLAITGSTYAYEVEARISLADYDKDLEKEGKRQVTRGRLEARKRAPYETGDRVRYGRPDHLHYRVPDGLVDPRDIPPYAGLAYARGGNSRKIKDAPIPRRDKSDPEAYGMAGEFYRDRWNEGRKARRIEGEDMKDESRKSVKKGEGEDNRRYQDQGDGGVLERPRLCLLAVRGKRGARNGTQPFRSWRGT